MPKTQHPAPTKRRLWVWALNLLIWVLVLAGLVLLWFSYDLPSLKDLETGVKRPSIVFVGSNNQEIAHYGDLYGDPITTKDVPPALINAIVSMEDRSFFKHAGIDWMGIGRALWNNLKAGHIVQGGSTLTQQIAKNVFLTGEKSYKRKIQEILFAFWLEYHFTKEQLLNIYMNRVYFGSGTYGVDAASQEYFGKPVRGISAAEATILAALLKAPTKLSPHVNPQGVKDRAKRVAIRMKEEGYIKDKDLKPLQKAIDALHFQGGKTQDDVRYFTDWLLLQLPDLVDMHQDLLIRTTLDPALQARAQKAAQQKNNFQVAIVALDHQGAVRAMVGGRSYHQSMFNRATQAKRQLGSTFKFFVFLAAMEKGVHLNDMISDQRPSYKNWDPRNFGWTSRGAITIQEAFVHSVNSSALHLAEKVGLKAVLNMAKRLGLSEEIPYNLSVILGSSSGTLLELTTAFTIVAGGGKLIAPYGITEVLTTEGKVLYHYAPPEGVVVLEPAVVENMQSLLMAAVLDGTGKKSYVPGVSKGGKTGTTQKHRDAWFVGLTSDLVAGIWTGKDDDTSMGKVSGATLPAMIWKTLFQ